MYTIQQNGENSFDLLREGVVIADFPTREDAERAQTAAEASAASKVPTGTWVDDGQGLEYPAGTDNYHSGTEERTAKPEIKPFLGDVKVAKVDAFQLGSVVVIDVVDVDGLHRYIKVRHGAVEVGGSHEWDTGADLPVGLADLPAIKQRPRGL
jgi:hypothetical protein